MTRPNCVLTPSSDEGPYFVDEHLLRSDVRADAAGGEPEPGASLTLDLRVVNAEGNCPPVEGAHMDIWHCNALGIYSDESGEGTLGRTFLRGCQVTDTDGGVRFTTIFPGWYAGRAVHIHLKVRLLQNERVTYDFTTQLFFEEDLVHKIYATNSPYDTRGKPEVANKDDYIYRVDGPDLMVPVIEDSNRLNGSMVIGLAGLRTPG